MKMVADTNVFLAAVLNEPEKETIIRRTIHASMIAPKVLPYEMANALSAMFRRNRLTREEALLALRGAMSIPVQLVGIDACRALELALDHRIYAYDAFFLQCARQHSCPLLTLDRKMRQVANDMDIKVVEL